MPHATPSTAALIGSSAAAAALFVLGLTAPTTDAFVVHPAVRGRRFVTSVSRTWLPGSPLNDAAWRAVRQPTCGPCTLGMKIPLIPGTDAHTKNGVFCFWEFPPSAHVTCLIVAERHQVDVGSGSYVALVTPMTPDGQVDEEALRGLLRWHMESGTDGIVALGTTGEASLLSNSERRRVLEITVEEAGNVPIIAGTSSVNPSVVIEQSHQAAEVGADAVLVVTPAYVKPSQKGLVKFYQTVADEGALPVVLYNVPGRTAVDMHFPAVVELAKHPRIIGLKDATGDLSRIGPLRAACPQDFLFYSGDDETGMEYLLSGGNGFISVTADVAPQEMAELAKACGAGDRTAAEAINDKVIQLHTKLFVQGNPVTVKYALSRMGKIFNSVRLPLVPMEDQFKTEVDLALESAGLLAPSRV